MSTIADRVGRILGGCVIHHRFAPLGRLSETGPDDVTPVPAQSERWLRYYYLRRHNLLVRQSLPFWRALRVLSPLFAARAPVQLAIRAYSSRLLRPLLSPAIALVPSAVGVSADVILCTKYGVKLFDTKMNLVWTFAGAYEYNASVREEAARLAELSRCPVVLPLVSMGENNGLAYFIQPLAERRVRFVSREGPNLPLFEGLFSALGCVYKLQFHEVDFAGYVEELLRHAHPVLTQAQYDRLRMLLLPTGADGASLGLTYTHSDLVEQNVVLYEGQPRLLDWANYSPRTFTYDLFMSLQYFCIYYGSGDSQKLAEAVREESLTPEAQALRRCAKILAQELGVPMPELKRYLLVFLLEGFLKFDFKVLRERGPYAARLHLLALNQLLPLLA